MSQKKIFINEFPIHDMPKSCTLIVIGAPDSGKCFAPGTKIMMSNFSVKEVQNISDGEFVMGDNFTTRKVMGVSCGSDYMYEINGGKTKYVVNEKHILCLKGPSKPYITHNLNGTFSLNWIKNKKINSVLYTDLNEVNKGLDHLIYSKNNIIEISVYEFLNMEYNEKQLYFGYRALKSGTVENYNINIESKGFGKYYGFQVDGNGRFLLEDFTVTHNSTLIEDICYVHKHRYPVIKIFSGTEDTNKFYERFVPKLFISNEYKDEDEEKHILRQKTCIESCPNGSAINIIDDCSDDRKIYKSKIFKGLFKNGRHWNQLFILGLQYAIDVEPDIRKSISYVALFREPDEVDRKKLYNNFGGICGSYEMFCDLMDQLTGDHTCMIIKKRSQSNRLEDNVFYYKAHLHINKDKTSNWKFGCKELWDWNKQRLNRNIV